MHRFITKRWLLSVAAVLWIVAVPASALPNVAPRLQFRHLGLAEGLAQSSGGAIAQGPDGLVWLGTEAGLQRYDGYGFVHYHQILGDPTSLSQNDVSAITVTRDGTVWVGTRLGGLNRLGPGGSGFTHFTHVADDPGSLSGNQVNALLQDRTGQLWIAGQSGVDRLLPDGSFQFYAPPERSSTQHASDALYQDRSGRIWVGSQRGLLWVDESAGRLQHFTLPPDTEPAARTAFATADVRSILQSRDGRLWVGTTHGLFVLDAQLHFVAWLRHDPHDATSLGSNQVRALAEDANGVIWIGLFGAGLDRVDATGPGLAVRHVRHDPEVVDGLSSDEVTRLMVDATGLLWVGTYGGGFNIANTQPQAFALMQHDADSDSIADDTVWAIQRDGAGNVWVGTDGGLTRFGTRSDDVQQYHFAPDAADPSPVYGVYPDRDGRLWIVAAEGLFRNTGPGTAFQSVPLPLPRGDGKPPIVTGAMFQDRAGRLWAASRAGLLQFDAASGRMVGRYHAGPAEPIAHAAAAPLCQTTDGTLWIGTQAGLLRFDPEHAKFLPPPMVDARYATMFSRSDVLSCLAAPDDNLWVGTTAGLIHYNLASGAVRVWDTAEGMPSSVMYGLARDASGAIWVGTGRGLVRLDPDDQAIRSWGSANGLANIEFNQMAAFASDGVVYFGGIHGLTMVRLALLPRPEQPAARVAITGYSAIGPRGSESQVTVPAAGLHIPYWQRSLTFALAVLDYAAPAGNTFRYRLLGFDDTWRDLRGSHTITYTNLDAGAYTLEVRGTGSNGRPTLNTATLPILVATPPWARPWAWVGYATLAALLGLLGLRLFANQIRRRRDLAHANERLHWAENMRELDYAITQLDDEPAIARELMTRLPSLMPHQDAAFLDVVGSAAKCLAERGFAAAELQAVAAWVVAHAATIAPLCDHGHVVRPGADGLPATNLLPRRGWLLLPLTGDVKHFRCLLVARREGDFGPVWTDLAGILARQIGVIMTNAALIQQLADQARYDALTGACNRPWFREQADAAYRLSLRHAHAISVLMLDLDNFKAINDRHGHAVGDAVLAGLVACLRGQLRGNDILCRYGGEEFVVCLPETTVEAAHVTAERLRQHVADAAITTSAGPLGVTVSIGVASAVPVATDGLDALIGRADKAMYIAKHEGRNRVRDATPVG